ncbi:MAG: macro domain-containing protein [Candidatus Sumerlaeaceae bacterium]|nr:macro domain-containing protein [Candidatus Sumerlaeaceae bacterium]
MIVEIVQGDITESEVEAIVNAANTDLVLGGGVAGAIRRKGGPQVQAECTAHGQVELGGVAVTGSGDLPQKFIIHAATMHLRQPQTTAEIVAACTRRALDAAIAAGCKSMAFPALGTGVAGLDALSCARAMIGEVLRHEAAADRLERVAFVLFDAETTRIFREELQRQQLTG